MDPLKIWTPRDYSLTADDYGAYDRPGKDLNMFADDYFIGINRKKGGVTYFDDSRHTSVTFNTTLEGGDNKFNDLREAWHHTGWWAQTWGKCKNDNYISWHLGSAPQFRTFSEIYNNPQHTLPGYPGVRFEYRWPTDSSRNNWSNSPVHINKMMLHYFDPCEPWDGISDTNTVIKSYQAELSNCNAPEALYPDRFVDDDSRKSDKWKGATYECIDASEWIRNRCMYLFAMSVEMKYSSRGGATHSRCMDIRNLTPIWKKKPGCNMVPALYKPITYAWNTGWKPTSDRYRRELYLV